MWNVPGWREMTRREKNTHKQNIKRIAKSVAGEPEEGVSHLGKFSVKNPDVIIQGRNADYRRRILLEGAGTFTADEWQSVCNKHGNVCLRCGSPEELTVDHVVSLNRGGSNTIENLQPLCRRCNSSKGDDCTDYRKR